jgi:hypothetical protein
MAKATFTNTEAARKPTHWVNRETGSVMWKIDGRWRRFYPDGFAETEVNISAAPDNSSGRFEPRYGDLVITISFD